MTDTSTVEPASQEPAAAPAEPEATPAAIPEPAAEPSAPAPADGTDISEFLKDDADDLDEPVVTAAEPEVKEPPAEGEPLAKTPPAAVLDAPPAEPTAAATPPVTPPTQEPPKDTPTPAVEPPVTQPAAAAPAPEAQPPVPTMEELRDNYQRGRTEAEEALTIGHYALTEEQVEQLGDGDNTVISRLMSRVYMDAVTGAVAHMVNNLPTMVKQVVQGQEQSSQLEQDFFKAWPQLTSADHGTIIQNYAVLYRQHNPEATPEEVIRDVGAQVMVAFKLPTGEAAPAAVPATAQAIPPAAPFKPAGTSAPKAAPADLNEFEELSDDMGRETLDLDA